VLSEAEALLRENEVDAILHPGRAIALLLKRAAAGDKPCARVLAAAGEALGFAVASLITLFAPPKVIISGRAMATNDHFIEPLRKTVAALLPASLADVSDIVVREWSDENWVRGAAAMTLRDLYGAPWGTTGPASMREPAALQTGGL
jgi:predicted NBD/HSP70 family sugar kinase